MVVGDQSRHLPAVTNREASSSRRLAASISPKAVSAVDSVTAPGVYPTGMPRAVQALRSMFSIPAA